MIIPSVTKNSFLRRGALLPIRLAFFGSALLLFLIMIIGVSDVVGTVIFTSPVPAAIELSSVFFGAAIFLAWPEAQQHLAHIRVELFTASMPPMMKRACDFLNLISGLVFFSVITYGLIVHATHSWLAKERAVAILAFPVYPAKILAAIGVTLTVVVLAWQLAVLLKKPRKGGE